MLCKVISDYTKKNRRILAQAKRMANNFGMGEARYHLKQNLSSSQFYLFRVK
jgi:hypothetical protein